MSLADRFIDTTGSNNRPKFLPEPNIDEIVVGGDSTHSFSLPFDYDTYISSLEINYKVGLYIVLTKYDADIDTPIVENGHTYLSVHITPDESLMFLPDINNTFVQIKLYTKDNKIIFTDPCKVTVKKSLEY